MVRKDHLKYGVKTEIRRISNILNIKDLKIVVVDEPTSGQAESVKLAFPACIANLPILIFNIDTIHLALNPLFDYKYDGILETFYAKGDHWSFAQVDHNNLVNKVVEKKEFQIIVLMVYIFQDFNLLIIAIQKLI